MSAMSRETRDPIPNNIDKLLLIKLVNERPILWDITVHSYQCRILKKAAWQEVCGFLNKDYGKLNATEKLKFYNAIIKIWRHIRVTWRRSVTARAKGRRTGIVVRPYKYHKEMLFLRKLPNVPDRELAEESDMEEGEEQGETKVFEENESENEFENESNVDTKEEIDATIIKQEINTNEHDTVQNRDNIFIPELIDAKMTAYIDKRMQQMKNPCEIHQDRHFAFFKSVHPTLTLLNDDQILAFQSGVINLLQDIKSGGRFHTNDQPSSSGYHSQPEVLSVPRSLGAGPRVIQISSASARRIQPKMALDPLI